MHNQLGRQISRYDPSRYQLFPILFWNILGIHFDGFGQKMSSITGYQYNHLLESHITFGLQTSAYI